MKKEEKMVMGELISREGIGEGRIWIGVRSGKTRKRMIWRGILRIRRIRK